MLYRHSSRWLSAGAALAALAVGTLLTPVASAATSCPFGTPAYFASPIVYLGQEGQTTIWSSQVTLFAYCGSTDNPLTNVLITGIDAVSTGAVPNLEASADGSLPTTPLPVIPVGANPMLTGVVLSVTDAAHPNGILTDANGHATFLLRAQSPTHPWLAMDNGGPNFIGLHMDYGQANLSAPGPGAAGPFTTGYVFGGGSVFASTPELDSLTLFGTGAAGLASYALLRLRARRRR